MVYFFWRMSAKRTVLALMIVPADILANTGLRLLHHLILLQIYILIFQCPPESFHKYVVDAPLSSVHTDLNIVFGKQISVAQGGEV